ncbi:MAG: hypothetical protein WCN98_15350 [Verrucomicrobiaceae bacterium]
MKVAIYGLSIVISAVAANQAAAGDLYSWKCTFPGYKEPSTYFYDVSTGKAYASGNLGTIEEEVYGGEEAISFIERIPSGAVQTLTILLKTGEAVLSHHTIYFGEFSESQVKGSCQQSH